LVSAGFAWFRLEDQRSLFPSGLNIGNESKSECVVIFWRPVPSGLIRYRSKLPLRGF